MWTQFVYYFLKSPYVYLSIYICSCERSLVKASENLWHLRIMGIAEMWELSLLLLYVRTPLVMPLISELQLVSDNTNLSHKYGNSTRVSGSGSAGSSGSGGADNPYRISKKNKEYHDFKSSVLSNPNLFSLLKQQNELDLQLYYTALEILCVNLHLSGLWSYPIVRKYWLERTTRDIKKCRSK